MAVIDLLFNNVPVMESLRQWFVLLFSFILIGMFGMAIRRMYKTQRKMTFDSLVLGIEAIKVNMNLFRIWSASPLQLRICSML